jgi:toxin FitB
LTSILAEFRNHVLDFDGDAAQVWGRLQVPHPEHAIDKQIAAIALVNNLTVVTRNKEDFTSSGVRLINPFSS